jgi:phosphate-selective porin OprO/OprP
MESRFMTRIGCAALVQVMMLLGHASVASSQTAGVATSTAVDVEHSRGSENADRQAPAADSSVSEEPPSVYDRIWKFSEWYRNDSNPALQRLRFSGRYQHDYSTLESDQGNSSEWNVRRMRMGLRANLFGTITLHGEVDLNPQEADPVYVRLTDMYVEWSRGDRLALTVGKQSVPFTADGSTSSRELLAIDRSNLANNIWFPQEYLPGVSMSGSLSPWVYHVGLYSAGRRNPEFGEFTGGVATLGSIGYDFAKSAGAKEALVAVNYVYQNPNPDNTFTQPLQHVVSVNLRFETNRWWGIRSDLSMASGYYSQSDIWGVMAMPFVNASGKLQFVGRYTFLDSDDPNGIELGTYEDRVVSGRGDRYQELYLGANYYFYGHRLKLQSGVQWGDMRDLASDGGAYSGVAWTTGLRVGW